MTGPAGQNPCRPQLLVNVPEEKVEFKKRSATIQLSSSLILYIYCIINSIYAFAHTKFTGLQCRILACDIMRCVLSGFCGGKTLKVCWHHIDLVSFAIVNCGKQILGLWLKISKNKKNIFSKLLSDSFDTCQKNLQS